MPMTEFLRRVDERRKAMGLSERKLLINADLDLSTIRRVRGRGQTPGLPIVAKLEAALDLPANHLVDAIAAPGRGPVEPTLSPVALETIQVRGAVQAGVWVEAIEWEPADWFPITVPADTRYPGMVRYGLLVKGSSMDRLYPSGTVVVVVKYGDLARYPKAGERVVVMRRGSEGFEATLKEYELDAAGRHILWPRSSSPEFQSPFILEGNLPVDGDHWQHDAGEPDLVITGMVVGSYRQEGNP